MLEYLVRPYQARDPQGKIIIPSTPQGTNQQAILTWGASSTLPPAQFGGISVACCKENNTEQKRKGETVRITGSDNASYVDVFRANTVELKKKPDNSACSLSDPFGQTSGGDITSSFGDDAGFFSSSDGTGGDQPCAVTWNLHNNTTGAGASTTSPVT